MSLLIQFIALLPWLTFCIFVRLDLVNCVLLLVCDNTLLHVPLSAVCVIELIPVHIFELLVVIQASSQDSVK